MISTPKPKLRLQALVDSVAELPVAPHIYEVAHVWDGEDWSEAFIWTGKQWHPWTPWDYQNDRHEDLVIPMMMSGRGNPAVPWPA